MSIISEVLQYLDNQRVDYAILRQSLDSNSKYQIETSLLCDAQGLVIVAFPASAGIDLRAIRQITHRKLEFAEGSCISRFAPTLVSTQLPPLGAIWNIPTLVESCLFNWPHLDFTVDGEYTVRVACSEFSRLFPGKHGFSFSHSSDPENQETVTDGRVYQLLQEVGSAWGSGQLFSRQDVLKRLLDEKALPVMPGIIQQLVRLLANTEANVEDLVDIIEQDQALAARIVSLSQSAHYASQHEARNIFDAVYRVLGYDNALSIALAMMFSRQFHAPLEGRVGMKAVWEKSLTLAIIARYLALHTPLRQRVSPGMCYLAGLLHNVGYLAMAHLFPREYAVFNHIVSGIEDTPLADIESGLMGITPAEVSYQVMTNWRMPEACLAACDTTRPANSEIQDYVFCLRLAEHFRAAGQMQELLLPEAEKRRLQDLNVNIDELVNNMQRDNVAAEVPFLTDILLS